MTTDPETSPLDSESTPGCVPNPEGGTNSRKLAVWFWGSIFLMAAFTLLLTLLAVVRQSDTSRATKTSTPLEITSPPKSSNEESGAELEKRLNYANKVALEAVRQRLDPLLDDAYRPAYQAIPKYADFHYSVMGEYAELSAAAFGDVSDKLQEMLFAGLEERVLEVGMQLDNDFNAQFEAETFAPASGDIPEASTFGPLTKQAIEDVKSRIKFTVPISASAAIGTVAVFKVAATTIAKKITAKLAVKAAAKTGGKWAAAGTGAGAAALACSWSGPGAGLCAAVGGVGAWIVADYGIVKLDEYWNREDFEADLEKMLDEQKATHKIAIYKELEARAAAIQEEVIIPVVQNHDFTLRELSGVGNDETCKIAADLTARYDLVRSHLRARKPDVLHSLRVEANEYMDNLSLRPMVKELELNLKRATLATVSTIRVEGNLPTEFRLDRDVSGILKVGGKTFEIGRVQATESTGFQFTIVPEVQLSTNRTLTYALAMEQHRRVWGNRFFGGSGSLEILDSIGASDGLVHSIKMSLPLAFDNNATSIKQVSFAATRNQVIAVTTKLFAESLPALENSPGCD